MTRRKSLLFSVLLFFFFTSTLLCQAIRILPLGNSITYDNNVGDTRPIGDRIAYRHTLYQLISNAGYDFDFVGNRSAGNNYFSDDDLDDCAGFPGIQTYQLANLILDSYNARDSQYEGTANTPYLQSYPADIILLHIGTNSVKESAEDIETLLDHIRLYLPDAVIFIAKIINRSTDADATDRAITSTYNTNLETHVNSRNDSKIIVVDMENGAGINYTSDMIDLYHPNSTGYDKIAAKWWQAIDGHNTAPALTSIPNQTTNINTAFSTLNLYSYTSDAEDSDSDLDFEFIQQNSSQLSISFSNGQLTVTPASDFTGSEVITIKVTDSGNGVFPKSAETSVNFIVENNNDAPSFTSTPITKVDEDNEYYYLITTEDNNGDAVSIRADAKPDWLSFAFTSGNTTAVLSGTPLNSDVGSHDVILQVSDGLVTINQQFQITVTNTNDSPQFTTSPITSVNFSEEYSYTVLATDVDQGDNLTYSAPVSPVWLDFNSITRILSGTPQFTDVGTHDVTIRVNDGNINIDQQFQVTVVNNNNAPTFTSNEITTIEEDNEYDYIITTNDADGDQVTITCPVKPDWLNFSFTSGQSTANLSGTPGNEQVGNHNVTLRVSDGIQSCDQQFQITVTNTNDNPTFTTSPITSAEVSVDYSFTVSATDIDQGDNLTYSAPILPVWLDFNSNARLLSGTPQFSDVGTHNVTIRVNDGTINVDQVFQIEVTYNNTAPTFTSSPVTAATEDSEYSYSINTNDTDDDPVTITCSVKPDWLIFNTINGQTTATLAGTPENNHVGIHNVTLTVTDSYQSSNQQFQITVVNTNDPPSFSSVPPSAAQVAAEYSYTATATDIDVGDNLTFTAPVLPTWLSFDAETQLLSGIPQLADLGTYDVTIRVTDETEDVDQEFQIEVVNNNTPPTFTSTEITTVDEDTEYSYTVTADDVDGNPVSITAPVLPDWLNLDFIAGNTYAILSGTPENEHVGIHDVSLTVSDGIQSNDQIFQISVANTNDAPVFVSIPVNQASVNEDYSYLIECEDVDFGDILTYSAVILPEWLDFNTETQVLSGTPLLAHEGTHNVTIRVNDGTINIDQVFQITVVNNNTAPTFTSTEITSVDEDNEYVYVITTTDSENDPVSISALIIPGWLVFNYNNGDLTATLTGTPGNNEVGVHNVTLQVTDGLQSSLQQFQITVENTNDDPAFTSTPITEAIVAAEYSYLVSATDFDQDDILIFSSPELPNWLNFNSDSQILSGTPSLSHVGSHNVTIRVSDGTTFIDQEFQIDVVNTNTPPIFTSTPITETDEDSEYQYTITTEDIDDNDLTISAIQKPDWLLLNFSFGATSAILTGTPDNDDVGNHGVVVRVFDGIEYSDQEFTITVINTNDAPVFSSSPPIQAAVDGEYSYYVEVSDDDINDNLILGTPTLPDWLTFNQQTNTLSGVPVLSDEGEHEVTIVVGDGTVNIEQNFTIEVVSINIAPVFTSNPVLSADEDEVYRYNIITTDNNSDEVTISAIEYPEWLSFNYENGYNASLTGIPENDDVGTYSIVLSVTDSEFETRQQFNIVVNNVNDAPFFTSSPLLNAEVEEPYNYQVTALDIDESDNIQFSAPLIPIWLRFDENAQTLSGIPGLTDEGLHNVVLRIEDESETVDQHFQIEVINNNLAPEFTSSPVFYAKEDSAYSYIIKFSDPNEDQLSLIINNIPEWAEFNYSEGDNTAELNGLPENKDVGLYEITLIVSDGQLNDEQKFQLEVKNVNDRPVFLSTPDTEAIETIEFIYSITISDDDNDPVTFEILNGGDWLTIDHDVGSNIATLSGIADDEQVGLQNIVLAAFDGTDSVYQAFTIDVINVNDAPVLKTMPLEKTYVDEPYNYNIQTYDEDGDTIQVSVIDVPSWLTLVPGSSNNNNANLFGIPGKQEIGIHEILFNITDGSINMEYSFFVEVMENEASMIADNGLNDYTLLIYPNPTSDRVKLVLDEKYDITFILYNLDGKTLKHIIKKNVQNLNIDLSHVPAGVYHYKLIFNQKEHAGKLIKN